VALVENGQYDDARGILQELDETILEGTVAEQAQRLLMEIGERHNDS